MFKTTTLVYKFFHSGSPSYFGPSLSLSSCSYSTRSRHPDCQFFLFTPQSTSKSRHIGHNFAFDALRFGMISLTMYAVKHLLPPSGKAQKSVCKSLSAITFPSPLGLIWYDLAMLLLFILFYVQLHLRVCQLMEIKPYKNPC